MNTQDWSPSGWTGWTSLQSKGLSTVFSNTTVSHLQICSLSLCTMLFVLGGWSLRTPSVCLPCSLASNWIQWIGGTDRDRNIYSNSFFFPVLQVVSNCIILCGSLLQWQLLGSSNYSLPSPIESRVSKCSLAGPQVLLHPFLVSIKLSCTFVNRFFIKHHLLLSIRSSFSKPWGLYCI